MKIANVRMNRSGMFREYLRYVWSRPSRRISVETYAFARPLPVPVIFGKAHGGLTKVPPRNAIFGMLLMAIWLVIFAVQPIYAQTSPCPETNVFKYVQVPNTDGGFDLWDSGQWALADDFICTNTGPITDIHIWGSWLSDLVDANTTFWLGIYDDVPATNGPVVIPSHPGTNLIWQQYFGPGQYGVSPQPPGAGQFYNPEPPGIMGGDSKIFYYCFYPTNPPTQTGTVAQAKIYWLSVYAMPSQGTATLFGWKSSKTQQFDISTRTPWPGIAPITTDWRPNYNPSNIGLDLSFKIYTASNPPVTCCPETNGAKFVQHPKVPGGTNVNASQNLTLADDFLCTNTGPVTDIHLWGSWLKDNIDPNVIFTLSIWSDVPKQTNGGTIIPSHPGVVLWSEPFGPGEYYQCPYASAPEQFYDPSIFTVLGNDTNVYYLCFYPRQPFRQQGTATAPTNYWLSVNAQTSAAGQALFGWHTSFEFYNDVPVWGNGPNPPAWNTLTDTFGNPLSMAFKLTTPTNQTPPPCCPETNGTKFIQHPKVPAGLDVNASQNLVLADDFLCTNRGPVTDIHLWGSWLQDNIDPNVIFNLSIWSDVPKQTNGTQVLPSHPGIVLWNQQFGPGQYYQCPYTNMTEQFYDPSLPGILGGDTTVEYLCFYPTNPFVQQGTTANPTNYWLSVNAQTTAGSQLLFGWHTSYEYYNDTAVWGPAPSPAAWNTLNDLQGVPLSLAFKLTTPTNPPCPPGTIICPPNKTVECGTAWNFDDPQATNPCCGSNVTLVILNTQTNGSCPWNYTRTWQVTDCSGFTAVCSQTVTVKDTTPPTFTYCPTNRTVECGTPWTFDTPVASDNCCLQGLSLTTFTNGTCPQVIAARWTAVDCCGNTNTCTQYITNVDTTPPQFVYCPTNKTVECGTGWNFDVPIVTDNCCLQGVLILGTFTNGTCPQIITRVWLATDCCGNTNTCSQTVTNVDTTPPSLTCAPGKVVECGSNWTFDPPVASDRCCSNVTVSVLSTVTNGTCPKIIIRTWVASDCCGNTNTCSQVVTNIDTTPPVLTCSLDKTVECGSAWTFDTPVATDACCSNPIVSIISTITNSGGSPCNYIVSRIWRATDCCGNQSLTCTQRVTVVDTTPPTLFCTNKFVGTCGTNAFVTWSIMATDNCTTNIIITSTPPSGQTFARGTTNHVHVTASDGCNTNTCDFNVIVRPPSLTIVYNGILLGTVTLTWEDGILQSADDLFGPYSDVPLATSPYTTSAMGPQKFYRTRCP
jgi:hypothetical protein